MFKSADLACLLKIHINFTVKTKTKKHNASPVETHLFAVVHFKFNRSKHTVHSTFTIVALFYPISAEEHYCLQ